jgi:hypothetical protein
MWNEEVSGNVLDYGSSTLDMLGEASRAGQTHFLVAQKAHSRS